MSTATSAAASRRHRLADRSQSLVADATGAPFLDVEALRSLRDDYEAVARCAGVRAGRIDAAAGQTAGGDAGHMVVVESTWSAPNVRLRKSVAHKRMSVLDCGQDGQPPKVIADHTSAMLGVAAPGEYVSPSGRFVCHLIRTGEGKEKRQLVSVFDRRAKAELCCVDVTGAKKHAAIVTNDHAGGVKWSNGEGHLLYVANKLHEPKDWFELELNDLDEEKRTEQLNNYGTKFEEVQSWGEQLHELTRPALCIMDVTTGNITVLDNIPEHVDPLEPQWCADDSSIYFVGFHTEHAIGGRLGMRFCSNRPSTLYRYDVHSAQAHAVAGSGVDGQADAGVCAMWPRVTPDGTGVVFAQRTANWTHAGGSMLMLHDTAAKTNRIVLDMVRSVRDAPAAFPGLNVSYIPLADRCFSADSRRLIVNSAWGSSYEVVCVNLSDGSVTKLSNIGSRHGSWGLWDVRADLVLVSCSAPTRPHRLLVGRLPAVGSECEIVWQRLDESDTCAVGGGGRALLAGCTWDVLALRRPAEADEDDGYVDMEYECVLLMPDTKEGLWADIPLVVLPHGGPHGNSPACFSPMRALFAARGYATLAVNYRGSVGFGEDCVDAVPGKCGTLDIRDCHYAATTVLDLHSSLDRGKVFVCGSSHGGFVGAHLAGQYPDFYKGFSLLNPVLDFGAMMSITDIPDWCVVESLGRSYTAGEHVSPADAERMLLASPMRHAHRVRAPVMLNVSEKDLRVVPHHLRFRDVLRANGVRCVVRRYAESNHAVVEVDCGTDFLLGTIRFFDTINAV